MDAGAHGRRIAFGLDETMEQLEAFALRWIAAVADRRGRVFAPPDGRGRLVLPPLAPVARPGEGIADYVLRFQLREELVAVLLLRAGAAALGCWYGSELLDHVAIRKYVVRGHGKAQPTHLKTKGKSRYGSRLRLQNWRRLLGETNERLGGWWQRFGAPARVFVAAPVRVLADLRDAEPPPPFGRDGTALQKIPFHVHRPDFAELLLVWRRLGEGGLELPAD